MQRSRQGLSSQPGGASSFQELSGLPFNLGAAGQQYLADTPWANPKHPAHMAQRKHSQTDHTAGSVPTAQSSAGKRASTQSVTSGSGLLAGVELRNGDISLPRLRDPVGTAETAKPGLETAQHA